MYKHRNMATDIIARSNPYWKPIWSKRVLKRRKLTKALTTIVGQLAELEAELKDLKAKLKDKCTHPRNAQEVFEWSISQQVCTNFYDGWGSSYETVNTRYWEVKCTICNQIVNDSKKEERKKKKKRP